MDTIWIAKLGQRCIHKKLCSKKYRKYTNIVLYINIFISLRPRFAYVFCGSAVRLLEYAFSLCCFVNISTYRAVHEYLCTRTVSHGEFLRKLMVFNGLWWNFIYLTNIWQKINFFHIYFDLFYIVLLFVQFFYNLQNWNDYSPSF